VITREHQGAGNGATQEASGTEDENARHFVSQRSQVSQVSQFTNGSVSVKERPAGKMTRNVLQEILVY
jgi:hypothetical protein